MGRFRSGDLLGIAESTLELVRRASADSHPNEYMGMLRGEDARTLGLERDGTVIAEVLVVPATETDPMSATVRTNLVPNDLRGIGSVHSHPNGVLRPSDADLATFTRGRVHLIVGAPYGRRDWQAYNRDGEPIHLPVLDVDPRPEEHFFDFTQEDIDAELAAEGVDTDELDRKHGHERDDHERGHGHEDPTGFGDESG